MAGELTATGATLGTSISPGLGSFIGAGVGAVGDLIGGLFGSSSSKKESRHNRHEARRQFNEQMDFQKNATQYRVRDALKAGINPLAALGVSSNVSPTMSAGGNSDAGYQKGSAISSAINRISQIFNRQEQESRDLDLEAKRIRNDTMRAELNIMRQPGMPSGNTEQPPIGTDSQLFRIAYDLNGDPRLMVNQDVTENDSDNAGYLSSLQYAYRNGSIGLNGDVVSPQLRMKIADDYKRATGRDIQNLDRLYISPSELALAAVGAWRQ